MTRSTLIAVLVSVALVASAQAASHSPARYIQGLLVRTHVILMSAELRFERTRLPASERCFAAAQVMTMATEMERALMLLERSPALEMLRAELAAVADRFKDALGEEGPASAALRARLGAHCRELAAKLQAVSDLLPP